MEHDSLTNNDDFGARYYRSAIYRWISPDWSATAEPVPYANLNNPQTLNLYAMVTDNPESTPDPDGHQGILAFAGTLVLGQAEGPSSLLHFMDTYVIGLIILEDAPATPTPRNCTSPPVSPKKAQKQTPLHRAVQKAKGAYHSLKTWAHNHPKTTAAVSISLQVGLALATDGGSEFVEGAADAAEAGGEATAGDAATAGETAGGSPGATKDRTLKGVLDRIDGLEHKAEEMLTKGGYRISKEGAEQDLRTILSRIKSLGDAEEK